MGLETGEDGVEEIALTGLLAEAALSHRDNVYTGGQNFQHGIWLILLATESS